MPSWCRPRTATFTLDDYIEYLVAFLEVIGPGAHMLAVCQPSVPSYAATCVMNAANHPCTPRTITMMGGPIDTREAPTVVNTTATQRPLAWFEQNVVATVPFYYPGGGRKVYPGFLQLAGFMAMNLGNHLMSHYRMFQQLVDGDGESAEATKSFYEEYRSVCDMTAEFYLQTIEDVFQKHKLPKGELLYRGTKVDPAAITKTAILAIEGERDDISGLGPDQGGVDDRHRAARADEALLHGRERRPLRHLQRPPLARDDRAGGRGNGSPGTRRDYLLRHPGLVPGSTDRQGHRARCLRPGGPRNKSGVTGR